MGETAEKKAAVLILEYVEDAKTIGEYFREAESASERQLWFSKTIRAIGVCHRNGFGSLIFTWIISYNQKTTFIISMAGVFGYLKILRLMTRYTEILPYSLHSLKLKMIEISAPY